MSKYLFTIVLCLLRINKIIGAPIDTVNPTIILTDLNTGNILDQQIIESDPVELDPSELKEENITPTENNNDEDVDPLLTNETKPENLTPETNKSDGKDDATQNQTIEDVIEQDVACDLNIDLEANEFSESDLEDITESPLDDDSPLEETLEESTGLLEPILGPADLPDTSENNKTNNTLKNSKKKDPQEVIKDIETALLKSRTNIKNSQVPPISEYLPNDFIPIFKPRRYFSKESDNTCCRRPKQDQVKTPPNVITEDRCNTCSEITPVLSTPVKVVLNPTPVTNINTNNVPQVVVPAQNTVKMSIPNTLANTVQTIPLKTYPTVNSANNNNFVKVVAENDGTKIVLTQHLPPNSNVVRNSVNVGNPIHKPTTNVPLCSSPNCKNRKTDLFLFKPKTIVLEQVNNDILKKVTMVVLEPIYKTVINI